MFIQEENYDKHQFLFFVIIIIWIMSARWAGDEIMNNPTVKSHIYMGLAAPTSDNYSGDDEDND